MQRDGTSAFGYTRDPPDSAARNPAARLEGRRRARFEARAFGCSQQSAESRKGVRKSSKALPVRKSWTPSQEISSEVTTFELSRGYAAISRELPPFRRFPMICCDLELQNRTIFRKSWTPHQEISSKVTTFELSRRYAAISIPPRKVHDFPGTVRVSGSRPKRYFPTTQIVGFSS